MKQPKLLKNVPHGINIKYFFPIDSTYAKYNEFLDFKKHLLKNKEYEFVLLFNARNIRRKSVPDLILAYKLFCEKIGKEKSNKCLLLLHTQPVDEHGTDLPVVLELLEAEGLNIEFSDQRLGVEQMNYLYNSADATILLSSNEGWGLSLTESLVCGKMIIANVTGGMQDQMRFENENGEWIKFSTEFCSNHFGTYKKCGEWAVPVFPSNMSLVGSIPTPYIFDDRVDFRDAAKAIEQVYNLSPEERKAKGMKGKEWAVGELPKADISYLQGELDITQLLGAAEGSEALIGGVGWIVPAALAMRKKAWVICGGQGGYNAPELICPPGSNITFAVPDNFCRCRLRDHMCDKRISNYDTKLADWAGKALPVLER